MSLDYVEEALRDAKVLAARISPDDYLSLKKYWQSRSYTLIAYMLRRYGIDFKGLTYLEALVGELLTMKENRSEA